MGINNFCNILNNNHAYSIISMQFIKFTIYIYIENYVKVLFVYVYSVFISICISTIYFVDFPFNSGSHRIPDEKSIIRNNYYNDALKENAVQFSHFNEMP